MSKPTITFAANAWHEYLYWQKSNQKTLKKINILLEDITRNPLTGLGKPERLTQNLQGCWSRRIDQANRLVYKVEKTQIEVISCKSHYGQK